jgi:hypothetical protein
MDDKPLAPHGFLERKEHDLCQRKRSENTTWPVKNLHGMQEVVGSIPIASTKKP